MKKISKTLVVILMMFLAIPASACSQSSKGVITGGACSIKELNNLEKYERRNETIDEKVGLNPKRVKNLRPTQSFSEMTSKNIYEYYFGMCLSKTLLGR